MEQYEIIKKQLYHYSYLGIRESQLGATHIGKAPHIAPEAWLNNLYSTINAKEIEELEQSLGVQIPFSYKCFLNSFSNGLNVMADSLYLYGKRSNFCRNNIEFVWQPYDIVTINKFEKPKNASKEMFFIGGYNWDGSRLYMLPDQTVHYCRRYDATSLLSWDSLSTMLREEIERLYSLFDYNGIQINETHPTIPVY